jgi:hypothetical protein
MSTHRARGIPVSTTTVDRDVPCRRCGYNLRGLSVSGRCPECGAAVSVSVQGDWLCYSEPGFLRTLRRGISYILWSMLFSVAVGVLGIVLEFAAGPAPAIYIAFASLLADLLGIAGAWMLTAPDPGGIGEDRYGASRKIIRITLAIGAVYYLFNFMDTLRGAGTPGVHRLVQAIAFLAAMIGLVGEFAQLSYLSRLALRLPDSDLSRRARQVMWGLGVSYGAVLIGRFAGEMATASGSATQAFGCVFGIVGLVSLFYLLVYISVLRRFGVSLDEQFATARQIWSYNRTPET